MNEMNEILTEAAAPVYETVDLAFLADELADTKNALILTHVNPDGDCIGSAFALRKLIRACGGDARVICPNDLPKRLRFLASDSLYMGEDEEPCNTRFDPETDLSAYDRILSIDVASPVQLGDLAALMFVHEDEDILLIAGDGPVIRMPIADISTTVSLIWV